MFSDSCCSGNLGNVFFRILSVSMFEVLLNFVGFALDTHGVVF